MIDILGHPSLALRGAMVLGLSVALKATPLMLVALAIHLLLGRRRPLVRSVIWNACLLGLLRLPVSAAAFPRLLLDAPRGSIGGPEVVRPIPESVAAKGLAPAAVRPARTIPISILPPAPKSWRDWSTVVCLAYVAVAAALAARLMLSLLAVERLRRSSPAVGEQPWVEALDRWRGRLARIERSAGASRCLLRAPARGVIVVAVLAAFGLLGSVTLVRPRADEPKPRDQTKDRRVRIERVKPGKIRRTTTQPGALHAFESAELFAKVSGYLKQQNVDIGDRVKQGELLAVIDVPELTQDAEHAADALEQAKVAVTQAEARLKTARSELEVSTAALEHAEAEVTRYSATVKYREKETTRYNGLFQQKAIPQQVLDEMQAHLEEAIAAELAAKAALMKSRAERTSGQSRVEQAMADLLQAKSGVRLAETNLNRAKIMVDYTRVVSPYNGVVTFRGFHPGAFIRAPDAGTNVPLFTVARTDKMRVVTYVPDRDVPDLKRGDPAEITLDALPGQTFRGKVARFAETEDAQSRTMRTEIDLDNSGNKFREGMHGLVTIVLDDPQPGLTIPVRALVRKGEGSVACFRIVDGRAVLAPIKLGYDDGRRVQVVEGLKEGDAVVVDPGADGVEDGKPVVIEER